MDFNDEYLKMVKALNIEKIDIIFNDFYLKEELNTNLFSNNPFLKKIQMESYVLNDNFFLWNYKTDDSEIIPMGEFHFISIEEVISSENKKLIKKDDNTIMEIFPFDDHPNSGNGVMGCLRFIDNQTYEIWLYTENGELLLMKMDLEEYIKRTLELKAIFGWQYLFTDINWKSLNYSVIKIDLIMRIEILKKSFPEFKEKDLLDRFN